MLRFRENTQNPPQFKDKIFPDNIRLKAICEEYIREHKHSENRPMTTKIIGRNVPSSNVTSGSRSASLLKVQVSSGYRGGAAGGLPGDAAASLTIGNVLKSSMTLLSSGGNITSNYIRSE